MVVLSSYPSAMKLQLGKDTLGSENFFWSKMDFIAEEIYRYYLINVLKLLSQNTPRAVNGGEVHEWRDRLYYSGNLVNCMKKIQRLLWIKRTECPLFKCTAMLDSKQLEKIKDLYINEYPAWSWVHFTTCFVTEHVAPPPPKMSKLEF